MQPKGIDLLLSSKNMQSLCVLSWIVSRQKLCWLIFCRYKTTITSSLLLAVWHLIFYQQLISVSTIAISTLLFFGLVFITSSIQNGMPLSGFKIFTQIVVYISEGYILFRSTVQPLCLRRKSVDVFCSLDCYLMGWTLQLVSEWFWY